jgi:glucokinase
MRRLVGTYRTENEDHEHVCHHRSGGTHCRFARFAVTARGLALEAVETCPTARLQDGSAVLAQWESCLHTPLSQVAALVMGVAGPVQDGLRARLSNAPLRIDLNAAMPQFGPRGQ